MPSSTTETLHFSQAHRPFYFPCPYNMLSRTVTSRINGTVVCRATRSTYRGGAGHRSWQRFQSTVCATHKSDIKAYTARDLLLVLRLFVRCWSITCCSWCRWGSNGRPCRWVHFLMTLFSELMYIFQRLCLLPHLWPESCRPNNKRYQSIPAELS